MQIFYMQARFGKKRPGKGVEIMQIMQYFCSFGPSEHLGGWGLIIHSSPKSVRSFNHVLMIFLYTKLCQHITQMLPHLKRQWHYNTNKFTGEASSALQGVTTVTAHQQQWTGVFKDTQNYKLQGYTCPYCHVQCHKTRNCTCLLFCHVICTLIHC